MGFAASGVPGAIRAATSSRFAPNNLRTWSSGCWSAHRGQVAAVHAGAGGRDRRACNGPVRDADRSRFCGELSDLWPIARGRWSIFDEIMTGFRYPRRQRAARDAASCPTSRVWGKALAAEACRLSALIGRAGPCSTRRSASIYYEPTFKGEAYSFAAAREALAIYPRDRTCPRPSGGSARGCARASIASGSCRLAGIRELHRRPAIQHAARLHGGRRGPADADADAGPAGADEEGRPDDAEPAAVAERSPTTTRRWR